MSDLRRIEAVFGCGGDADHDALFAYVHDLVLREGTLDSYEVAAPMLHLVGRQDAHEPAAEVAASFRRIGVLDQLGLPPLRDPDHEASADANGVRLVASSTAWLAGELARWLGYGGPPERVSFSAQQEVRVAPAPSLYVEALRAAGWALASVAPGDLESRWYDAAGRAHIARVAADGAPLPCPTCRATHASRQCERLLMAVAVAGVASLEAAGPAGVARWSSVAPTRSKVWCRTPTLDGISRTLARWEALEGTRWDVVDPPPSPATVLRAEARFDEVAERAAVVQVVDDLGTEEGPALHRPDRGRRADLAPGVLVLQGEGSWVGRWLVRLERALGHPLAVTYVATRRVVAYAAPTHLLVFKALTWLAAHAGEDTAVQVGREGGADVALPLAGPAAPCDRCGGRHPAGLCEAFVAAVLPSDALRLSVAPGGPPGARLLRLEVALRGTLEARATGDRLALFAPLEAWGALEGTPWDPPPP